MIERHRHKGIDMKLNQRISCEFIDETGDLHQEIFGAEQFAQEFAELIWRNPQYRLLRIYDRYGQREIQFSPRPDDAKPAPDSAAPSQTPIRFLMHRARG